MSRSLVVLAVGILLLSGVAGLTVADATGTTVSHEAGSDADDPRTNASAGNDSKTLEIVGVAPDPIADGDAGEYVVLSTPVPTNTTGWTIVDDRHVVLGSLNWNEAAYEENREVVIVLTGEEVVEYYAGVFEADPRAEAFWRLPTGLVGVADALWIVLGLLAIARIRWAA